MNRLPAIFHRLSVGLVALLLIVVGGGTVAWRTGLDPIADWIERIDAGAIGRFAHENWWTFVVIGVAVLALVWGLSLIRSVIRPGSVTDLELDGSDETGTMIVAPKQIANAVADELSAHPIFDKVSAKAVNDRSRDMIRLEVTARPTRSIAEMSVPVGDATDAIRDAVAGTDMHVQALVHLEKPKAPKH
ncbi:hypothetical protein [Gordonia zhaorongruii]|uniref:hypothetical protein n=1 Tax=Gordonia zhaorongruii TaxID=2597659 RepID=UPI0010445350|nr:hypothetical protein [Gordonia zhaorongruii]